MNKRLLFSSLAVATILLSACKGTESTLPQSEKEAALKAAIIPYTEHTVLATYQSLRDASAELKQACEDMFQAYEAGVLSQQHIVEAARHWEAARKYWEQSEAFLYGPASIHNIDPHIDSWPLDRDGMEAMLGNEKQMAQIEAQGADYISSKLGYGLLGFHALEYMLYAHDNTDKSAVQLRSTADFTRAELVYLTAVSADLAEQTEMLYDYWKGNDEVGTGYAWYMVHAGEAGSIFVSYQDAAEQLIQGCIDIADEVGNTKIGTPANAASAEDRNYIESPYSLNSIEDFQDNILSIRHAYEGAEAGDASLSEYVRIQDKELDARCRAKIDEAIRVIAAIPEPFAQSAAGSEARHAVDVVGTELVEVLQEVYNMLSRND